MLIRSLGRFLEPIMTRLPTTILEIVALEEWAVHNQQKLTYCNPHQPLSLLI